MMERLKEREKSGEITTNETAIKFSFALRLDISNGRYFCDAVSWRNVTSFQTQSVTKCIFLFLFQGSAICIQLLKLRESSILLLVIKTALDPRLQTTAVPDNSVI
jgi:hypothetical protein